MSDDASISLHDLAAAERLLLLAYDERRRRHLPEALARHQRGVEAMRDLAFPNDLAPASVFSARAETDPLPPPRPPATQGGGFGRRPERPEDAVHATIPELAAAFRAGRLRSRDLTEAFLARIDGVGADLKAVVTVTAERARAAADQADRDFAAGIDRGPLQGIPWLAKDLLALPDGPTTWGAAPYREQRLDATAAVIERLDAAGAVLLGKASLGALAMGDVWFGGTTLNPWNPDEGSSGSSAGSAAGVAAGLATFAIGSETMGSILSPSERCRVVGLRPTFGRVSRHGAMALSWSLDKLGPITRSVEDAALVLTTIAGADARDPASREAPLPWTPDGDVAGLRIGVPEDELGSPSAALAAALATFRTAGAEVVPVALPDLPTQPVMTLLMVEGSAAFDELIRGEGADLLVRQSEDAWPTLLRAARFVSGADYLQAQRLQRRIRDELAARFGEVDLIVSSALHREAMLFGNAAGAPIVTLPVGRDAAGATLGSVAAMARPFFEHLAIAAGIALERADGPLPVPPGY
jgi:Asp-tRNA(Asn)/Glu-tRNA(Gln) amidotransferase A subunit family amidase